MELLDHCPFEAWESMENDMGAHPGITDEKIDEH